MSDTPKTPIMPAKIAADVRGVILKMGAILVRQSNPSQEIEYREIYIPNEENLGTGSYTIRIKPKTLFSIMELKPAFQLSVNLHPATCKVSILQGRADGTPPLARKIYLLPQQINHDAPHDFMVRFQDLNVISLNMDTISLEEEITPQKIGLLTINPMASRVEYFRLLSTFLNKVMPDGWFNNPKNQGHPIFQRWILCQNVIFQNGGVKLPKQKKELPLYGQLILETEYLKSITDEKVLDQFLEPVKVKIANYLQSSTQFADIMLEITIAAWHLMENHKTEILEVSNYPDVKVNMPDIELPFYLECKNIAVDNDRRVQREITEANKQLRSVSEPHYGIVILNIAKPIKLQQVNSDTNPRRVDEVIKLVKKSLTGKQHRSVGAAIVIWDDFIQLGNIPPELHLTYRKRFVRIDHTPEVGCMEIPQNAELFKGAAAEFELSI